MCGRYTIRRSLQLIAEEFAALLSVSRGETAQLGLRYNVCPTQQVPAIVEEEDQRQLVEMRWGLLPHWAKDDTRPQINARSETVAEKPFFRTAFKHRCLMPADGFYEWEQVTPKVPYLFEMADGKPWAFAGIFSTRPEGRSCCLLTRSGEGVVAPIHDRMPVILTAEQWEPWLSGCELAVVLKSAPSLKATRVRTLVNSPKNNGPELIEPA